jgi:hypothetical protein
MMRIQRIVLLLVFAAGFIFLSVSFKRAQFPPANEIPPTQADNTLNERQRVYLDRHTELTKWLIALSYAILAGLVARRFADTNDPRISSFSCSLGAVMLLLSLYAGFLSHQSILILMSFRPLAYLGSSLTVYPLAAQMIFLAAGTAFLVFAFLRPGAAIDTIGGTP